jgi:hypothetical protein
MNLIHSTKRAILSELTANSTERTHTMFRLLRSAVAITVLASGLAVASGHTPIASANTMATITATGCRSCGPWTPYPINVTGSGFRPNGSVWIDVYDQNATHLLSETRVTASSTGTINTSVSASLPWAEYVQVHAGQILVSSNVSQTFVYMSGQISATGGRMGLWITGDHFMPGYEISIPVYGYANATQYTQIGTGYGVSAADGTLSTWVSIAGPCPQYPAAQAFESRYLQRMGSNGASAQVTC